MHFDVGCLATRSHVETFGALEISSKTRIVVEHRSISLRLHMRVLSACGTEIVVTQVYDVGQSVLPLSKKIRKTSSDIADSLGHILCAGDHALRLWLPSDAIAC